MNQYNLNNNERPSNYNDILIIVWQNNIYKYEL